MENIIIIVWLIIITGIALSNLFYKVGYKKPHGLPKFNYEIDPPEDVEKNPYGLKNGVYIPKNYITQIGIAIEKIDVGQNVIMDIDGKVYLYRTDEKRPEFDPEFIREDHIPNNKVSYSQFELIYEYLENEELIDNYLKTDVKSEYERFKNKNNE